MHGLSATTGIRLTVATQRSFCIGSLTFVRDEGSDCPDYVWSSAIASTWPWVVPDGGLPTRPLAAALHSEGDRLVEAYRKSPSPHTVLSSTRFLYSQQLF